MTMVDDNKITYGYNDVTHYDLRSRGNYVRATVYE